VVPATEISGAAAGLTTGAFGAGVVWSRERNEGEARVWWRNEERKEGRKAGERRAEISTSWVRKLGLGESV
jgi:hypothetical protein